MSESQKKKKKIKKKTEAKLTQGLSVGNEIKNTGNAVNNIKNVLPKLNIKTPDDIQITLVENSVQSIADKTQCVPPNTNIVSNEESVTVSDKGNKKNKKTKKKSKEKPEATNIENNDATPSFLNFSENGIHLKNHPEISVTYTNEQLKINQTEIVQEQKSNLVAEEQADNNSSKKKKKKKKKGNSNMPETCKSEPPPTESIYAAPTYTRVVTSDNTTVLLVNNENLAAASKSFTNMEDKNKPVEGKINVKFIASENNPGNVLITNKTSSDNNSSLGNSVSIFPVQTDANNIKSRDNINYQPGLETVSNTLKKNNNDNPVEENIGGNEPTKSQLKAERRAKQEAQRAAKLAAKENIKTNSEQVVQNKNIKPPKEIISAKTLTNNKPVIEKTGKEFENDQLRKSSERESLRKVRLFSHLPHSKQLNLKAQVHPAILEVGYQYNKGIVCGSNARCVALLAALREIIQEYKPQPDKNICRELESDFQTYLSYLNNSRPLSVSMVNAVKFLKHQMNHISPELDVNKTKEVLKKFIDDFVNEEILLAKEAIGNSASAKIVDGDVILVFSHSSLVKHVLCKASNENKVFRVIVADSRPKLEGLQMLQCLVKQGLQCSYISINAVSYVMKEVSKVIIGAHALLSNGCVMSRLGSKQVALVALSYSVPVLVCCETYKFCERVLTDSFVHNELGEPEEIVTNTIVLKGSTNNKESPDMSSLQLLNLLYDVTPPDLISMVITEKGVLPCTSVPVVLRVRYAGLHE